jgi:hypothetical protein
MSSVHGERRLRVATPDDIPREDPGFRLFLASILAGFVAGLMTASWVLLIVDLGRAC